MHRLSKSTVFDQTVSCIQKSVLIQNVYAFSLLLPFQDNIYDILVYCMNNTENKKLHEIVFNRWLKSNNVQDHIQDVLELLIEKKNICAIKKMLETDLVNNVDTIVLKDGCSFVEKIVLLKSDQLMKMLLHKYNVSVDSKDKEGVHLVIRAIENECPTISSVLILQGCDLNCLDTSGRSLLELCVEKKWFLHVNYILSNGYSRLYDDEYYFHRLCHMAIDVNSTLIFDKIVSCYFATKIKRKWRSWKLNK